jgi:hypothetical protein
MCLRKCLIILLVFPFMMQAQENISDSLDNNKIIDSLIAQQWNNLITPNLDSALWQKGKAYNAAHFYMVPLHAAFQLEHDIWQLEFANHFQKFTTTGINEVEPTRLYRLQYYYLASWFMVLAAKQQKYSLIPDNLYTIIHDELDLIWNKEYAWAWSSGLIPVRQFDNMRSRILWKLYNVNLPPKTFYRAIVDEEKFVFAIAANLKTYLKLNETDTLPANAVIDNMLQLSNIVWERRVEWNEEGGWLFQPGYWTDHPDYLFAGNIDKANPKKSSVENIAEDVSHSHRTALWLQSFIEASDSANKIYFEKLLAGLDTQFFNYALVYPTDSVNTFLTNNFMNGWNGLYRWNYNKTEPNTGYGPYELSGTMLFGWWTFLGSERIKNVYHELSGRFPIPENILAVYEARTGQLRAPDKKENHYTNGLDALLCKLAALLK